MRAFVLLFMLYTGPMPATPAQPVTTLTLIVPAVVANNPAICAID